MGDFLWEKQESSSISVLKYIQFIEEVQYLAWELDFVGGVITVFSTLILGDSEGWRLKNYDNYGGFMSDYHFDVVPRHQYVSQHKMLVRFLEIFSINNTLCRVEQYTFIWLLFYFIMILESNTNFVEQCPLEKVQNMSVNRA